MVRKNKPDIGETSGNSRDGRSVTRRYKEMGEFWDTHDATDFIDEKNAVEMNFSIESEVTYCALDNALRDRLQKAAVKHGVSSDTLVNMWVQDKLEAEQVR